MVDDPYIHYHFTVMLTLMEISLFARLPGSITNDAY